MNLKAGASELGPTSETFAERLSRLRASAGLSAAALAVRVGVGEYAIRKLEYGGSKLPSFTTGLRLARVLHVSAEYLAFGAGGDRGADAREQALVKLQAQMESLSAQVDTLRSLLLTERGKEI